MERATKIVVLAWTAAALAGEVYLVGINLPALASLSTIAFVSTAFLAWLDRRTVALVLASTYVFPTIVRLVYGRYHPFYAVLWMVALFGALAPALLRTSWRIPQRWRGPLVLFALTIVVSASLVVWREIDFYPALLGPLGAFRVPSSVGGGSPAFSTIWVLRTALVLVLGILWFDWLCANCLPPEDDSGFRQFVATPLAISAAAMAGVAVYQLFVDVTFLNETVYGNIGRASGTLFDSNVCGVIAAMWIGGVALWADGRPHGRVLTAVGMAVGWLAVWATGSRTAFGAAVIVTLGALAALYRRSTMALPEQGTAASARLRAWRPVAVAALAAVALLGVVAALPADVTGPLGRIRDTLPGPSAASLRAFLAEMWNRNGYGAVATRMIAEAPWFGVGVGSFHILVSDFAQLAWPGFILPSDNAQNWYRHQFAEFGLVGSLGWMLWVVSFAWFVVTPRAMAAPLVWIARGMVLAFAAVSLVGMPGQDIAAALTFWTAAFWLVLLAEPSVVRKASPGERSLSRATLILALLVVLAYGAGTAYLSATWLRVPFRAERLGWPFSYGFYYVEPDGEGGEQRWARRRAVAVVESPARWLALRVSVNHLDLDTRPVHAKAWVGRTLVLDVTLSTTNPVVTYVEVPEGQKRITIETAVDRTVWPRDMGSPDQRELGLLVGWRFLDVRPPM